jgi:hypothetical protein
MDEEQKPLEEELGWKHLKLRECVAEEEGLVKARNIGSSFVYMYSKCG